MPLQIIPTPLGMILERFLCLMVFLLMDTYIIPMGIVSVDLYDNYLDRFFMQLAISCSLYSNELKHLQKCTLELLSPPLFCLLH